MNPDEKPVVIEARVQGDTTELVFSRTDVKGCDVSVSLGAERISVRPSALLAAARAVALEDEP